MHIRTLRLCSWRRPPWPLPRSFRRWPAPKTTAQSGRLEIKRIGDDDSVHVEIGPAPKTSLKLVPFPEDLEESADSPSANSSGPSADRRPPNAVPHERLRPCASSRMERKTVERLPATAHHAQPRFPPALQSAGGPPERSISSR